jgi:hypothetical protein
MGDRPHDLGSGTFRIAAEKEKVPKKVPKKVPGTVS